MNDASKTSTHEIITFLNESLNLVTKQKPQSILIAGEEGSGKTFLINEFISGLSNEFTVLFHFNPETKEDNPYDFLYQIFHFLWNNNSEFIKNVKEYFINNTKGEISVLNENVEKIFENSSYRYYYGIIPDLLKDFIFICSQHNNIVLIIENLQFYSKETINWFFQFIKGTNHPILTIFTTDKALNSINSEIQTLSINPLNVKKVEQLVKNNINCGELNAKFITNFLHIKSQGNAAFILNMANEIFNKEELYSNKILNVNKINPMSLPTNWFEFWEYKWERLANKKKLEKIFYYFLLFPHEKNYKFWKSLFQSLKMEEEFKKLVSERWFKLEKNLGATWVYFYNSSLLDFIKIKINDDKSMLFVSRNKNKSLTDKIIPQLSYNSLLLSAFSLTSYQLSKIFTEIKKLIALRKFQHAINIVNTLVLSPEFEDISKNNQKKIIKLLAELFEYQGNYENAILYYHRLKDLMKLTDKDEIREINYLIGKNLFKIDKVQEAHILLKKISLETLISPKLKAKINILYGLIHFHNHQYEQSLKFFNNSIKILSKEKLNEANQLLKSEIYSNLAKVYRIIGKHENAIEVLNLAQEIYLQQNEISSMLKIVLHKSYIWYNYYEPMTAIKKIVSEYYCIRNIYAPGIIETIQKQIAELYWLVGKWRYSLNYYKHLFEFFSWRGDIYNASFMIGNMASISKEIGEFGDAARLEETALRYEHISQNTKAMVYSLQNLGHIYLVLGNYYTANEQLSKALHLSEKNNFSVEQIRTLLLLAFLFTRQKKLEKAGKYLENAKNLLDLKNEKNEWVNYLFYNAYWHIENDNLTEANSLSELFLAHSKNIIKYQCTGTYLKALIEIKKDGKKSQIIDYLKKALKMTDILPMVFWRYQIAYTLSTVFEEQKEGIKAEEMLSLALESIMKISKSMKDKILEIQFWESSEISNVLAAIKRIPDLNLKLIQWQIDE